MVTWIATLAVFVLVFLAMSLGALIQGRRLRGSCGGRGEGCECSPLAALRCPRRGGRDPEADLRSEP